MPLVKMLDDDLADVAMPWPVATDSRLQRLVRRAITHIEEHLAEPLTIGSIARAVGVSPRTLSRFVAQEMGMTVIDCLLRRRVARACQHLANDGLSCAEIAFTVGFQSVQNFNRTFRRFRKTTPTAYRAAHARHTLLEEELRDSEALYESLVQYLPCRLIRKDRQGRFVYANPQFLQAIGKSREQILTLTDYDLFPKEIADQCWQQDLKVMEDGSFFENVEQYEGLPGGEKYFQVLRTPVRNSRGEIIGVQIVGWDITEREQAKKQLSEASQALRTKMATRKHFESEKDRIRRQLLATSRQADTAKVATAALRHIGKGLNSVSGSATLVIEKVRCSKAAGVAKMAALLRERFGDLAAFRGSTEDRRLADGLALLADSLAREQEEVQTELTALQGNIDHIEEVVAILLKRA